MGSTKFGKSGVRSKFCLFPLLVSLALWCLPAEAQVRYTVIATWYRSDAREVSLPDVFIMWAVLAPGAFDNDKWYPGPDPGRKHTESGTTWNWNTLELPPEAKPVPPDFDFAEHKESFKRFYKVRRVEVRITWRGKTVTAPVNISWDSLGPWNYQDNYWSPGEHPDPSQKRRLHTSLPRGSPASEAAYFDGYMGGLDEAGRKANGAGIDLSSKLADELGFSGRDNVEVEFLWVTAIPPLASVSVNITSIDFPNFPEIKAYTTVEDITGEPMLNLGSSHFKVYEDQTRESPIYVSSVGASFVGTSVCIVMDTSGSMDGYPIRNAREAAIKFVNNLKPEDKAALISFREVVTIEQPFTDDRDAIINAIGRLYADGSTAFYDAVYKGVAMASTQPGIKAIVALTDGVDNSSLKTAKEVVDYAKSVSVPIYVVGFVGGDGIDERTLRLIADETEGQYYQTADPAKLLELYESISERLRNLYEVSYTTHNKDRDRTIRSVTVQVTHNRASGQDTIIYIAPGLEGAISGVVLDSETGEPVKSTSILVEHETQYFRITDASTSTNEQGEYLVENLSTDYEYRITASAMNYHKVVYPRSVRVRASEITEGVNFELQSVDAYFAAKRALIQELRDSEEIYAEEEDEAEQFLRSLEKKGALVTDQEEEALRRLYMVESFSKEAYTDSRRLAQLGTDGLAGFVDIGMAVISACGGVGEVMKKIPFVGEFLASPYIAAKNEMVNHIAVKSHVFLYQNYNVPWTLKGDVLLREAIGKGYDRIFILASEELATKDFSNAMAEVHKFIEKEFFLGIYELTTANFMDKSVEWAESSDPVFRAGRLPSAEDRVNQLLYSMNITNEERIKNAEILIWTGDTIGKAGAVASGVVLAGGVVLSAVSAKTVIGAPLAAVLIPLSTKIAIATSTAAGGVKLGTTAGIAVDLWSTIPNYVKEATAYSFDMPSSALAAPQLTAEQQEEEYYNIELMANSSAGLRAPSNANMLLMPEYMQYTLEDYNTLLNDVYDYIQNDEPGNVQEILGTLVEYGDSLIGDINVSTAQILAASPRALNQIPDYDAMYSKFEGDLSKATSERISLYTLLALYLADPEDNSIKDLISLQIGKTKDTNYELEETLTSTTLALREANVTIPTLVIIKSFSTPDVTPRGEPFTISAVVKNIGQREANEINVGLSVPRGSGFTVLERSIKRLEALEPGEERRVGWELEYAGRLSAVGGGVNLVTISVGPESEIPDFDSLPPTYVLIPAPPPTPPTGGKLANMNVYAYPNPFNPDMGSVNIRYSLSKDANITIEIYDASGELATTLIEGESKSRLIEYSESWDGRNDQGDIVANGVYFYLITTTADEKAAGKIAVLR